MQVTLDQESKPEEEEEGMEAQRKKRNQLFS